MANIELSDASLSMIEEHLRSGEFRTADEVVSAGLHLLRQDGDEVRQLVQEGMDDIEAGRYATFEKPGDLKKHILGLVKERRDARTVPEHVTARADRSGRNL